MKLLTRLQNSWMLFKGAGRALNTDKRVVWVPVSGFLLSLLVIVAVWTLVFYQQQIFLNLPYDTASNQQPFTPAGYALVLTLFITISIISTLVAGVVTHAALERFYGRRPSLGNSIAAAKQRIGSLSVFALFNYGVGYILSQIAERIPFFGGRIIIWLADVSWRIASFFAVPVIMTEDKPIGPIGATKQSVGVIKKVWGESLAVGIGIGAIALLAIVAYGVVGVTAVALLSSTFATLTGWAIGTLTAVFVLGLFLLVIIINTLEAYAKAAIYYYARTGESPASFNKHILQQAFTHNKAKKVFSH